MASSPSPPQSEATDCQGPDSDNGPGVCGATAVAHQRCLAHLTPEQLTAYLATLGPGSDINAHGVRFSSDLLRKLLSRFRRGVNASVGTADFSGAVFADYATFHRVIFRKRANFSEATFSKDAWFYRNHFLDDVSFDHATFSSGVEFRRTTFKHAYLGYVQFGGPAEFLGRVQELVLTGAEVSVELMMESTAGAVKADNLRGRGRISLRLHGARVDLSGLVFKGPVSVHALQQPLHGDESSSADPVTGVPPVRVVSLGVRLSKRCLISGCFGHAARLRRSMVSSS